VSVALLQVSALQVSLVSDAIWSPRRFHLVDSHSGATFWRMPQVGVALGVAVSTPL